MATTTLDQQPITITTKLFIGILISTITIVVTVVSTYFQTKSDLYNAIKNMETENKIQDLKYENLKLEVERNKMSLDRMREEMRDGRL